MDMTRYETMPGGPALVPEFGSAATPQGHEALRVISAYHRVRENPALSRGDVDRGPA